MFSRSWGGVRGTISHGKTRGSLTFRKFNVVDLEDGERVYSEDTFEGRGMIWKLQSL
jgi:hypothetical protein